MKRYFLSMFALVAISASACGSATVSETITEMCDSVDYSSAQNCDGTVDEAGIKTLCKAFATVYKDTDECREKATAYAECAKEQKYECLSGGNLPQVVAPDPCETESEDFTIPSGACVDPTKTSTSS